jgi:GH24 family phage-related lysozyme (muramidase)
MLSWHTNVNYQDVRFNVIAGGEGIFPDVYADGRGLATIGIGFNLHEPGILNAVLGEMGIGAVASTAEQGYVAAIRQAVARVYAPSDTAAVRNALNPIMAQRAQTSGGPATFTMTQPQMLQAFNNLARGYEGEVNRLVPNVPDSSERAALFSLAYNSQARNPLIGTSLRRAIASGDRAEAWYEIRYNSNLARENGVAKRRYAESQLFGLYEAQSPNQDAEYKNIFAMYTRHEAKIKNDDATFSAQIAHANQDFLGLNVQPTTKAGPGGRVQDLSGALSQAADFLINAYAPGQSIGQIFAASNNQNTALQFHVVDRSTDRSNDLILGSEGNDTITAGPGKDYLYGGRGNDLLFASSGANSQIDVMVGGPDGPGATVQQRDGNDTFNAGAGYDVMIGDDASATFNVNTNNFPRNFNIIWGDNGGSTYSFTGSNVVEFIQLNSPTIQSIEQYGANNGAFAALFRTITGQDPSQLNAPTTIIVNAGANDVLVNNNNGQRYRIDTILGPGGTRLNQGGTAVLIGNNQAFSPTNDVKVNTIVASGNNDTISVDDSSGRTQLEVAVGTQDTLVAPPGGSILIGNGVKTTFKVDKSNLLTAIWGDNGDNTLDISGGATIYEVIDPNATLKSVANLDIVKLGQALEKRGLKPGPKVNGEGLDGEGGLTLTPNIIIINPSGIKHLTVNGSTPGAVGRVDSPNGENIYTFGDGALVVGDMRFESRIFGIVNGDFGVSLHRTGGFGTDQDVASATTPVFNLLQFQDPPLPPGAAGSNAAGLSSMSGPSVTQVTDQPYVYDSYVADTLVTITAATAYGLYDTLIASGTGVLRTFGNNNTLIGGSGDETLRSFGYFNTLIAGSAADTMSGGTNDTLIGNALGSTLDGSTGSNDVAAYAIAGVTVDLGAGTATADGSATYDTLIGIAAAAALGTGDTLIGGAAPTTLFSNAAGNTLIAGTGETTAVYAIDDITVDLAAGTAIVNGANSGDALIGIREATVSGANDVLTSNGEGGTLTVAGSRDTLVSSGSGNVLMAVGAGDMLVSTGTNDILHGNATDSTLDASGATGAVATYDIGYMTVDLGAGTAIQQGSSSGDTLINVHAVAASSSHQTLIAGSGSDTLSSSGFFNTLIAGGGAGTLTSLGFDDVFIGNAAGSTLDGSAGTGTVAIYGLDGVTVDLTTGHASVSGSGTSDTLIGISTLTANGSNDTLIASSGDVLTATGNADLLLSAGVGNTLIDGSGHNTLASSGSDDTFFVFAAGTTLDASAGTGALALYQIDGVVVDLGAGTATSSGSDPDQLIGIHTVEADGGHDTLIGGAGSDVLTSAGKQNTLIAVGGQDTLVSSGSNDVLFGNAAGSTLDGSNGIGVLAAYSIDDVTVDLGGGTATVNGSGISDILIGITTLTAFGTNDTLIGGAGLTTLVGQVNGNTLVAGTGQTVAFYRQDNVIVDLAAATATLNGASDTLVGINDVVLGGASDTAFAGGGTDTLTATGVSDTLIGGADPVTLLAGGHSNVLTAGAGATVLSSNGESNTLIAGSGTDVLSTSGLSDTLLAGSGTDTLSSDGSNNILVAGTGASTLVSNGSNDTLFGQAAGSTLIGGDTAVGTIAAYTLDDAIVDLQTGTATVAGSATSDSLVGIAATAAFGTNDTLIGSDSFASTLISNAAGNTLVAGAAPTIAAYALDNVTVDLSAATASVNGSSASDTLIGITGAAAAGHHDTLIAGSGTATLSSSGQDNTLIAARDPLTLVSTGQNDTLFGNANGSTLRGRAILGTIAAYALDDVTVNLDDGTATVNGSSISDNLIGIHAAAALGANDTLIAQFGPATLMSNAAGNTLIAGDSTVVAAYASDDMTVDLVAGTAAVNGSGVSDTLIGVTDLVVSGNNDGDQQRQRQHAGRDLNLGTGTLRRRQPGDRSELRHRGGRRRPWRHVGWLRQRARRRQQ